MEGHRKATRSLLRGISRLSLFFKIIHKSRLFQSIADIENNTAKEMTKLAAVIQVPFRSANQFLGEGGLQVRGSFCQ